MSQVLRRHFLITAAGLAVLSLPALAQTEKRVRRIGYFTTGSLQSNAAWLAAFREGMLALKWVEDRDYVIDARFANDVVQAGSGLVAELVATRPDLLLTSGEGAAIPLAQKTKTIPIVFAIATDPVGSGIVASLQRPGGNATGLTTLSSDISAKRLQLLKEAFPRLNHVTVLFERNSVVQLTEIEVVAPRMGVRITPFELQQPADIDLTFKRGAALGAQAYILTQTGMINSQRRAIADHTIRLKVPAIFPAAANVEAGGLMSYGPSQPDNFRRAAAYVDKILKGAKPSDLPVEQPMKFELILNLKTAKAMGIKFPQSILVRADRVIE
jgi:putative ABC transport system substrate-binding protein